MNFEREEIKKRKKGNDGKKLIEKRKETEKTSEKERREICLQ